MSDFDTPLSELAGFQARFAAKLTKLGIRTVGDLLYFFPARYEDFSITYPIADLAPGSEVTIQGTVVEAQSRRAWRRGMTIVEAQIEDTTGRIRAVWFNQPYLKDALRPGRLANFSGKVSLSKDGEMYLSHPTHEFISGRTDADGKATPTKHTARLVPVYRETRGLTSKGIRFVLEPVLKNVQAAEWLPRSILERYGLPEIQDALQAVHFPETLEQAEKARHRFSFEELFLLQLAIAEEKSALKKEKAPKLETDIEWLKSVLAELPFTLTNAQKKALWEVVKDLGAGHPMNRLLQGDVGSGKTIVAALAAFITARNGFQTAFMAPTEILARQHYESLKKLFGHIDRKNQVAVGLLAGKDAKIFYENDLEADAGRTVFLKELSRGTIRIAVGTHALISASKGGAVEFEKLGFVVVDEQHRFGVRQRAALKGSAGSPHYLSMSATPIPRTLMLTAFGDLEVSLINEMPKNRKAIITKIATDTDRAAAYRFVRDKIREGRQAFVICPRIDAVAPPAGAAEMAGAGGGSGVSGTPPPDYIMTQMELAALDMKSVKEEYEKLSKKVFPGLRVGMLHGKMKAKEKEEVMEDFRDGKADILVSTSVIEVGVDVPNASVMLIESSDAFGLAQLYQFRGRVGRGEHQSYCFLMTKSEKQGNARLRAIVEAKNGFQLAEIDLKLRGPGQFLGESQTGLPDLAMQNLTDARLMRETREAALSLVTHDPKLAKWPELKKAVRQFRKKIHLE